MKFKKIICILTAAVLLTVFLPVGTAAEETPSADFVEGELIFEYAPAQSSNGLNKAPANIKSRLAELGVTEITELETFENITEIQTFSYTSQPTVYVAKISGDVKETCRKLEKISGITYAEPNYLLETCSFTMPAEITKSTRNYVTYEKWYLEDIMNIPAAWEKYQTCGEGVTIAVIDNGFYLDATDFPVNLWDDGNGNHGWNTANNSSDIGTALRNDGTALNDSAHGSNVAGIIGMASDGQNGIGAAFGSDLMLLKVAESGYTSGDEKTRITVAAVAAAINFARQNGADVINMSLGMNNYSVTIKNAVDNAYKSGIVLIAAAGNSGTGTSSGLYYPAAASNVIGVMATDQTNASTLAYFSNFDEDDGKYYDVAVPGYAVLGCGIEQGKFALLSGTSQASPLVAACAALYISVYPDQSVDKVYKAIRESCTKKAVSYSGSTANLYRYPMLDAVEMLDFGAVKPEIEFNLNTMVTHDPSTGYIYGLDENFNSISDYVTVTDGTGTAEFTPTANGGGTGSILNVYTLSGELYKSFTVVIFGDVNGDCIIDGEDSVIIDCIKNNMGDYSDCIKYAADADFDGSIGDGDITLVSEYAVGMGMISQIR